MHKHCWGACKRKFKELMSNENDERIGVVDKNE